MARKPSPTLTDGELKIMEVLWERDEATVRTVADVLSADHPVAYSTVQTMLGILHDKGFVDHRKEGRAFVYTPLVDRQSARRTALRHVLRRFFGGSPTALAESLLAEDDIDLMELKRLEQRVRRAAAAERRAGKRAGDPRRGSRRGSRGGSR